MNKETLEYLLDMPLKHCSRYDELQTCVRLLPFGWLLDVRDLGDVAAFSEDKRYIAQSTTSLFPICRLCLHGEHQVWPTRSMLRHSERSVHLARGKNFST